MYTGSTAPDTPHRHRIRIPFEMLAYSTDSCAWRYLVVFCSEEDSEIGLHLPGNQNLILTVPDSYDVMNFD
jgi:hypothetical protein